MTEKNSKKSQGEARQPFHWVDRFLKPLARLAGRVRKWPDQHVEAVFWLLVFLVITPVLRAGILFPPEWAQGPGLNYSVAWFDVLFPVSEGEGFRWWPVSVLAAVLLLVGFVLFVIAVARRRRAHLVVLLPCVGLLSAYISFTTPALSGYFSIFNTVYAISSLVVFLYFIVAGRVRSLYFAVYMGFLIGLSWIDGLPSWHHIMEFLVVAVVLSLIYETVRQNWPLLKQISQGGKRILIVRTFSLWSPSLLLIAAGLWISNQITSTAEQLFYDSGIVIPFCQSSELGPASNENKGYFTYTGKRYTSIYAFVRNGSGMTVPVKEEGTPYFQCPEGASELDRRKFLSVDRREIPGDDCAYLPEVNGDVGRLPRQWAKIVLCPKGIRESVSGDITLPPSAYRMSFSGIPFFLSLDETLAMKFAVMRWRIDGMGSGISGTRLNDSAWVAMEAERAFRVVPRGMGLYQVKCRGRGYLKCEASNLVKGILTDAYVRLRSNAERRFIAKARGLADNGVVTAQKAVSRAVEMLKGQLDAMRAELRDVVNAAYQTTKVIQLIFTAWLIVIAIKSFLYVLARVIFDKSTDIHVDLVEDEISAKQGKVRHHQEIEIPGDYPYTMYYKSNFQPLGPAPRFSIPQWWSSLLSRLRFGAWSMSRVDMPCEDAQGLTFNAIEAEYLVDWEMEEGEEVVFGYDNFVAMNENVELRTVISLRVATMLMGRFVFHTARCKGGPGRLILRTRGKPATAEQVRQSIPASRLIAWNRYARFSVDSHLTRTDIFLNGFNLRRSEVDDDQRPQGIIVVEADARSGSIMTGTLRFAKNFLLPI